VNFFEHIFIFNQCQSLATTTATTATATIADPSVGVV
jgi:hypothetical protein